MKVGRLFNVMSKLSLGVLLKYKHFFIKELIEKMKENYFFKIFLLISNNNFKKKSNIGYIQLNL